MIPVLTAEESQLEAERLHVGTGTGEQADRQAILDRWRASRGGPRRKAAPLPRHLYGAFGLGVEGTTP